MSQKKKISTFALVMMICVTVAGGGFGIEDLVGSVGPGMTMLVFILLPFVWSLPFGLSSAELSSAWPEDGGMYTWAKQGLGEKAGFVSGWCYTIAGFVEPATFAVLSANYMKMLLPIEVNDFVYWCLCAALIVIFAIINIIGIKVVSNMATVITLLGIIPFLILVVLSLMDINYSPVKPMLPEDMSFLQAAGNGLLIGIWFNTGFETISTMSGDIEDGSRKVPKAIVIAVPLISIMYILWVIPALASVGHWEDWSSEGPLSFVEIGEAVGGAPMRWAFVAAGSLASMMILCEYILAYAYVMKSFSEKGQFFKIFSKEHKRFKTPYMAIIILSSVSIILCSSGSFIEFVGIASILYAVPVIMMFIANIKLRVKNPDLRLDFKVPLPNKVYIAYLCFPIVIYGASVFTDNWIVGLGLAATSIPAYLFFKKIYRGGRYWEECHKEEQRSA
ncbi:MAG: APC family permease [Firmicutes bacterium]|nr:APC family permease [Bacillota bacterium]NBI64773.1 APC family permease [Clostridiales bacterium]